MTNRYKKIIYSLCAILSALGGQKINAGWRSKAKYVYKHCVRPPVKGIWKFGKYISNTSWGKQKINDNITDKISNNIVSRIIKNKDGKISQNIYSKSSEKLAEIMIKPPVYATVSPLVDKLLMPYTKNAIESLGIKIDDLIMKFLKGGKLDKDDKVFFSQKGSCCKSSWEDMKSSSPLEYVLGTLYRGTEVKDGEDKVTYKTYDNFMMALNEAIISKQNDNPIISGIAKTLREKIKDNITKWVYIDDKKAIKKEATPFYVITENKFDDGWTELECTNIEVSPDVIWKGDILDKLTLKYKFGDKSVTLTFNLEDNTNTKQTNDIKVYEIDCGDSKTKKLVVKFETNQEEKQS